MKKAILLTVFYFFTILCFSQSIKNFREPDSLEKKNYAYLKKRFEETIKSEPSNAEIFANTIITKAKKEKNNSMLN